jgi:hypothetical protein
MHWFTLLFTRVGIIFSQNENSIFFEKREQQFFFSEREQQLFFREWKQESRKFALGTLMIRYVSLVAKSDENR